jgi:hypothetical protein
MAKSGVFRKMHGIPDKQLMAGLGDTALRLELAARVINHNGRVLILSVVLGLVEAAAVIYLLLERGL